MQSLVSGIMFTLLLAGILTSAFSVQPVKAEPQTYVIVHALNPERIEIASIEGMNPDCVEIYDGDTLIGYSAYNNETYNKPLAISPGTHNIGVKFNGMKLTQNIDFQEGKTQIVTFIFSRISFNLNFYIYDCDLHSFISGSWTGKTPRIDDTDEHPYTNWGTNTHFEEPADCGRSGSYTGEARLQFTLSGTSYDWYNYASYTINAHGGDGCPPETPYWASSTEPDSGSYSIPSQNPDFNDWFLQYAVEGNAEFHVGDIPLNNTGILLINANSDSTLRIVIDEHLKVWGGAPATREDGGSGTFDTKMSSVPYDLTGTGIEYALEGWIYVPQDYPSIQEAIDAAETGDTIVIAPGVYHEQLIIDKNLTLLGQKGSQTTFEGSGSGIAVTLLPGASGSTIAGIVMTNWDQGVLIVNSSNCTIYNNIFSLTTSGGVAVRGDDATNNTISSNIFQNNAIAINLTASSTSSIIYNNISENEVGIDFSNSNSNVIYHNNFVNNIEDRRGAESFNVWDNGIQGNHWSGHNPPDGNMDKIGDDPYEMDEDNVDRYPLIYPYEFYELGYSPKPDIDKDGKISIIDVATVARAFGSKPGDEKWNPLADMDINETINIVDVAKVAAHFGEKLEP
jgi:parallel beta-helix repeat protein